MRSTAESFPCLTPGTSVPPGATRFHDAARATSGLIRRATKATEPGCGLPGDSTTRRWFTRPFDGRPGCLAADVRDPDGNRLAAVRLDRPQACSFPKYSRRRQPARPAAQAQAQRRGSAGAGGSMPPVAAPPSGNRPLRPPALPPR